MQPTISQHFATPFLSTKVAEAGPLNAELSKLFLGFEQKRQHHNPHRTPSKQVGIYESDFDLFDKPFPAIQAVGKHCLQAVWLTTQQLNGYTDEECRQMRIATDAWFHITHFGGYIANHNHPNASWSGVYMVDPGEHSDEYPESGVLSFKDPRPHANMYLDEGNYRLPSPFHLGSVNFKMKAGDLLIFPSYLQHDVAPYMGKSPRITIAFNCSVSWKQLT